MIPAQRSDTARGGIATVINMSPHQRRTLLETICGRVSSGEPIVLIEDRQMRDGADLVVAAALITTQTMAYIVRYTSGFVTVALPERRCNSLCLPPIVNDVHDWNTPTHAVAVDASNGTSTGISSRDRARTARVLADPSSVWSDLRRPGHVIPHRVPKHAYRQGAADLVSTGLFLCSSAGYPASVRCELVDDAGDCQSSAGAVEFARAHNLLAVSMSDVLAEVNPSALAIES